MATLTLWELMLAHSEGRDEPFLQKAFGILLANDVATPEALVRDQQRFGWFLCFGCCAGRTGGRPFVEDSRNTVD